MNDAEYDPDVARKWADKSMHLPAGKTCSDCVHYRRCEGLFGCRPINVTCDWSPSRFQQPHSADGKP